MGASFSTPMKICSACKIKKPLDQYHKNKHSPDGKRDRCPDCIQKKRSAEIPKKLEICDEQSISSDRSGYMYVIIEREFIKTKESIYKIGMTNQYDPRKRLQNYPHDSRVLLLIEKPDARRSENIVKDILRAHREIIHRSDIGAEYFEGDPGIIVQIVFVA